MNFIDEGGTVPVPFNMIPSIKSFRYAVKTLKLRFNKPETLITYDFTVSFFLYALMSILYEIICNI